jgi:hypothetical protein
VARKRGVLAGEGDGDADAGGGGGSNASDDPVPAHHPGGASDRMKSHRKYRDDAASTCHSACSWKGLVGKHHMP